MTLRTIFLVQLRIYRTRRKVHSSLVNSADRRPIIRSSRRTSKKEDPPSSARKMSDCQKKINKNDALRSFNELVCCGPSRCKARRGIFSGNQQQLSLWLTAKAILANGHYCCFISDAPSRPLIHLSTPPSLAPPQAALWFISPQTLDSN